MALPHFTATDRVTKARGGGGAFSSGVKRMITGRFVSKVTGVTSGRVRIKAGRKDKHVTLSRDEYDTLLARIEELEDLSDLQAARAASDREELSSELTRRLLAGEESRVKLWREHRGLTARALAEKADVAPGYLSEIETGKKPGSIDAMTKIARALDILVDDLIDG
jgi:DNA-binding XRE family transcriptional regulator